MSEKDIYHYSQADGEYLGDGKARPDPMEPGRWLIPAWATDKAPPAPQSGKSRHWDGLQWVYRDIA